MNVRPAAMLDDFVSRVSSPNMAAVSIYFKPSNLFSDFLPFFRQFLGLFSIDTWPGWMSLSFPFPSLVVELLSAFKPDRDWFVCHLSQPDWGTKSFSFSSRPNLVIELSVHLNLFATGFVRLLSVTELGQLILSVRYSQCSY